MSCGLCGKTGELNEDMDGIPVHEICLLKYENMNLRHRVEGLEDRLKEFLKKGYR